MMSSVTINCQVAKIVTNPAKWKKSENYKSNLEDKCITSAHIFTAPFKMTWAKWQKSENDKSNLEQKCITSVEIFNCQMI